MIYFGYSHAHADDAHWAVHTGLGILERLRELNRRLACEPGVKLTMRLGIHTGVVIMGEMSNSARPGLLALGGAT
ncbi:hypothetical protein NKDENANG_03005 [Candidatus Entotheonellaceae bacterium PAL068K]